MSFFSNKTSMSELKEGKCNKKGPIWSHFSISESDKSKAICNYCLGAYSLGSEKPKYQTSSNLKGHLKSKHTSEYLKFKKTKEPEIPSAGSTDCGIFIVLIDIPSFGHPSLGVGIHFLLLICHQVFQESTLFSEKLITHLGARSSWIINHRICLQFQEKLY